MSQTTFEYYKERATATVEYAEQANSCNGKEMLNVNRGTASRKGKTAAAANNCKRRRAATVEQAGKVKQRQGKQLQK